MLCCDCADGSGSLSRFRAETLSRMTALFAEAVDSCKQQLVDLSLPKSLQQMVTLDTGKEQFSECSVTFHVGHTNKEKHNDMYARSLECKEATGILQHQKAVCDHG